MLAVAHFTPILIAVMIGWILSVCVHEFSHALIAYLGGDASVRRRGYLRFDPLSYIHPVTSILLPVVFLMMGGIPLPGGAVYIDEAALRNRHWRALVSAAGPASNFVLFLVLAYFVHPARGLIDPNQYEQPMWAVFLGALLVLQLFGVFFNLIPIPPLDGFGIIEPYLPTRTRVAARNLGWGGLFVVFLLFSQVDTIRDGFMDLVNSVLQAFGLPFESTWRQYNLALFGSSE
ncbi:MAG: site-2 protease family protein [Phycisphaerae bacterium]